MTAGSGDWYVIVTGPAGHGFPGAATISQKPFPPGATEVSGPYETRAAALTAANQVAPKGTVGGGLSIPNPFSWVGAVSHWIGDFVLSVTDVHMWISLGWIVLGLAMMAIGLNLWLGISQKVTGAMSSVRSAAAQAA